MAKNVTTTKVARRNRKNIEKGQAHIHSSFNNTIVTITDTQVCLLYTSRRKISGTAERPRLCVYRSNSNIYAQIIDDVAGNTLVQASTLDKEIKTKYANKVAAKEVGTLIAKRAIEKMCIRDRRKEEKRRKR